MNSITTNREFFSKFLVKQTRAGGLWEAVAPLPGDWFSRGLSANSQRNFFAEKPLPPRSGATGVYFCKFRKRKYIFVKNENKKIKKPQTFRA